MARMPLGAGCALIAALLIAPAHAQSNVRLQLGGDAAKSSAASSSQAGVRVWRGAAAAEELPLLGGEAKTAPDCDQKTIVVKVVHRRANRLRTQGFYSGLERKGWKYTQGFYSGQKTYR